MYQVGKQIMGYCRSELSSAAQTKERGIRVFDQALTLLSPQRHPQHEISAAADGTLALCQRGQHVCFLPVMVLGQMQTVIIGFS